MSTSPTPPANTDLRRVFESLPDPLFTLDAVWQITFINARASTLVGRDAADLVGQVFWEAFPETAGTRLESEMRRAREEARVVEYEEFSVPLGCWLEVRVFPDGDGVAVHYRDVTARVLAERRTRALSDVMAALARPLAREEVTAAVLAHALPALGAYAGVIVKRSGDGQALEVEQTAGYDDRQTDAWRRFDLALPLPATECVREDRAVFLSQADFARDYPALAPMRAERTRALAALPLRFGEQVSGALLLSFAEDRAFDAAERQFMLDLAAQCAQALDRAHAFDTEVRAARHARALVDLGARLTEALSVEEVARAVVEQGRQASGAYGGALYVLEEGHLREVERQGYAMPTPGAWQRFSLDAPHLPALVVRDREAVFLHAEDLDARYPQVLRAERTRAVAVLPLTVRGRLLGVLGWAYGHEPEFDTLKRGFLTSLASQAALALERVRQAQEVQAGQAVLRDREERYRVLSTVTNDALWEWQFEGDRLEWNDGVYALFGYARGEVKPTSQWWEDHINPGDRGRVLTGLEEVIDGETDEWRDEYRFARADGSYATVLDRGRILRNEYGQVLRMIGGMTDLSERERHRREVENLNASLEQRVDQRTEELQQRAAELQAETDALSAFAAFTEGVGTETDLSALARRAVDVLHTALREVNVGYYELEDGRWVGRALSSNVQPEVARAALAGFAVDVNSPAEGAFPRDVLFVDDWNVKQPGLEITTSFGAAAFFPYVVDGRPYGLLTMASTRERRWSPRARAVFGSVARGLALAFERAETARVLREQNAELYVRTRALEGFAELARDLAFETDTNALVQRTQEIVLSLLPAGSALYYEPEGDRWRVRVQTGDIGNAGLQAVIDAGLPFEEAGNLIQPWRTGEAYYQETYVLDTDGLAEQAAHIGSTAAVPILVNGQPRGVLAVALFGTRAWDATDRVVLETAARHLTLALERAAVLAELGRQRVELQAANEELETFSYSVSHDLRAPLRHIGGFAGMLRRAVEGGDPARTARALDVIDESVTRAGALIDALLKFSHLSRQPVSRRRVNLTSLVESVRAEAEGEAGGREVDWVIGDLPTVKGDPDLLRQVFANLLANAVKYSRRAERIRVEVGCEPAPGETVVFVRDSGAGFDPRYADRLFGVFQRLHHPNEFQGTGIGLATVRRIVQRHGGRVWAQSTPGEGATFSFSLPEV